jgi:hypothetical protein
MNTYEQCAKQKIYSGPDWVQNGKEAQTKIYKKKKKDKKK